MLTVFVAVRKKLWVSIICPEFSIMNIKNLIIFVKVGYFKSGVRVGINHQETLVSLWEAHPQGVSAEAAWLLLPPVLTCHHVIRILGQCFLSSEAA